MIKKRILFIAPFPPPVHGSAMVSQIIKDSKLINETFDCKYVNISLCRKMEEAGKPTIKKSIYFLLAFIKTIYILLIYRIDLCYLAITCHGLGFIKDSPFVLICKLFRKRIIIHQHNKGMSRCVEKWPYRWLLPMCYKNAKVILLSWHLYPDIERVVPKENVLICPNGIPDVPYTYKERNNIIPKILFLSNLMPSKGVFVLLDALKILKDKGVLFICDFVGGETKEINAHLFVDEVNKRELKNMVIYHGRKYGEEKYKFFHEADVFVFPTSCETFGLVLLEAMQHCVPCISFYEGGIPDIISDGNSGIICEKNNTGLLASAILLLLRDKDRRTKMGLYGRDIYEKKYTIEAFENNFVYVIKKGCYETN